MEEQNGCGRVEGLWKDRGGCRNRGVVEGPSGCGGTERLLRNRRVVKGQRGLGGTEGLVRDREVVKEERGCGGTELL